MLIGRQKTCGILIEGALSDGRYALVIGIGINVAVKPENPLYPVTCLHEHGSTSIAGGAVCASLCVHGRGAGGLEWRKRYSGDDRAVGAKVACGIGEKITVNLPDRSISRRISPGSMIMACLMLDTGGGKVCAIAAGDVFP